MRPTIIRWSLAWALVLFGFHAEAREPVQLAKAVPPEEVDGKAYDVVVIEGTPGGIACAVRVAREGLSVLMVQHNGHIGGMLTNGLCQWDALYAGFRAPIFRETARAIEEHYRRTYGEKSAQFKMARFSQDHYPMSRFEPSVAERELNRLIAVEKNLTLLLSHYPSGVAREGDTLRGLTLREYAGGREISVQAKVFVDASYEGDLAALAKVPYRVGREGRDEYGEPHAGKVFTNITHGPGPVDAVEGRLNLHTYAHVQGTVDPSSPFTADAAIQAYNHRFCLSTDPQNRRLPEMPPNYRREEYVNYNRKGLGGGALNGKGTYNNAILPGENHAYPDADWAAREKIIQRHQEFALGLMYFLQNDESVSEAKRAKFRESGLPLDEYPDNENLPYELYVREARRIVGRYVFRQQDNMQAAGLGRTPIHADSIAITDWSMDSHDCTTDRRPGFDYDGKLILTEESRPAQVPWRSLLPQGVDNLIVPVCLSATHVAWGAVRLEPTWMQIGEAAGVASALAVKQKVAPAKLAPETLIRGLCERQFMVTFLNDGDVGQRAPWSKAAQYFGTKGFFHDYNARMAEPLKAATARLWVEVLAKLDADSFDPNLLARSVAQAEASSETISEKEFAALLSTTGPASDQSITRGAAIQILYSRLH